jgi:hypothetical protein
MVQLGIGQAPGVVCRRQRKKSGLPAGEFVKGRAHRTSLAQVSER